MTCLFGTLTKAYRSGTLCPREVPRYWWPACATFCKLRFTPVHFATLPAAALASISPANPAKRLARVLAYAGLRLVGNVFRPIRQR